ncbi:MAG TPA: glutamyl-tRNA reductase [Anaerolineales bacterium]|nr:glutamyl-tRNA reductase [Anaerolineales bacterium]
MNIHCLGINHNTASVALRECLSFGPHKLNTALARLGCGMEDNWIAIRECVILSTCCRVEIYAVAETPIFETLETFLAEIQDVSRDEISQAVYRLLDVAAVTHLFHVAAGLDSIVLGEPQILGQVTEAYSTARKHNTVGKILSRLFQAAIYAGKRTRTETAISHNPASISSVAVSLIAETIPALDTAHILVIGAGEMAELAIESLRKRGVHHLTVINRTLARAQELAQRWQARSASLETLAEHLTQADVVIASTGAPHLILYPSIIEQTIKLRPQRPIVLMDIAVPRDVDPDVGKMAGVKLYDMDTLAAHLKASFSRRKAEVPAVETILAEELAAFMDFLTTLDVIPIISEIRRQADAIREAELDKTLRRLPELSPEAHQQLDLLTRAIVKKILHSPTLRLREVAGSPHAADYANITRGLFGLD